MKQSDIEEGPKSRWVAVPQALIRYSKAWPEAELRLLLYFFAAEDLAAERGVSVPFAELAGNTGLGAAQARAGLERLARDKLVTADGPAAWRRLPASD